MSVPLPAEAGSFHLEIKVSAFVQLMLARDEPVLGTDV